MPYSDFHEELLALIEAETGAVRTDPDDPTKQATLFTSVETAHLSIVEFLNDAMDGDKGRPAPPYWAVEIGHVVHDPSWGVASRTFRAPVTIAVFDAVGNEATDPSQQSVHAAAEALALALEADGENYQSPPELPEIDSSASNPVFQALMAESKVDVVAATIRWEPGFLVQR